MILRTLIALMAVICTGCEAGGRILGDYSPPIITLVGYENIILYRGEEFTDTEAVAFDRRDGKMDHLIRRIGSVDSSRVGTYEMMYCVSDMAGNQSSVRRTVTVVEKPDYLIRLHTEGLRETDGRAPDPFPSGLVLTVGSEDGDCTTLSEALERFGAGESGVIVLREGIYTEGPLEVRGNLVISGDDAETTVIQPSSSRERSTDRIFSVPAGSVLELRNLTLRNGNPVSGDRSGGAVYCEGRLFLRNCVFSDNTGNCGGGVFCKGGSMAAEFCRFTGNFADGGNKDGKDCGSGGAVKCSEAGSFLLYGCSFIGNEAAYGAGAVKISCFSEAIIVNCTFYENRCHATGGGIHAGGAMTMVHTTIVGNEADGILRGGRRPKHIPAGGLYCKGPLLLINCVIAGNEGGDVFHDASPDLLELRDTWIGDGGLDTPLTGDPLLLPPSPEMPLPVLFPETGSGIRNLLPPERTILRFDQTGGYRSDGMGDLGAAEGP